QAGLPEIARRSSAPAEGFRSTSESRNRIGTISPHRGFAFDRAGKPFGGLCVASGPCQKLSALLWRSPTARTDLFNQAGELSHEENDTERAGRNRLRGRRFQRTGTGRGRR